MFARSNMGWYVTCSTCGAKEKFYHPPCGHREARETALFAKIKGMSISGTTQLPDSRVMMELRCKENVMYVVIGKTSHPETDEDSIVECKGPLGEESKELDDMEEQALAALKVSPPHKESETPAASPHEESKELDDMEEQALAALKTPP